MARGTGASKFAPANLNLSYGKQAQAAPGGSTAKSRIHGSTPGGMVVLSRPVRPQPFAQKNPKLAVLGPVNLPSLRKEQAGNDPVASLVDRSGVPGWTKQQQTSEDVLANPVLTASEDGFGVSETPNGSLQHSETLDAELRLQGQVSGRRAGVYTPPAARIRPLLAMPRAADAEEREVLLISEDFPALKSSIPPSPETQLQRLPQEQRDKQKELKEQQQNLVQLTQDHSGGDSCNVQESTAQLTPIRSAQLKSKHDCGNKLQIDGEFNNKEERSAFEGGGRPPPSGPAPSFHRNQASNWADDERDTSSVLEFQKVAIKRQKSPYLGRVNRDPHPNKAGREEGFSFKHPFRKETSPLKSGRNFDSKNNVTEEKCNDHGWEEARPKAGSQAQEGVQGLDKLHVFPRSHDFDETQIHIRGAGAGSFVADGEISERVIVGPERDIHRPGYEHCMRGMVYGGHRLSGTSSFSSRRVTSFGSENLRRGIGCENVAPGKSFDEIDGENKKSRRERESLSCRNKFKNEFAMGQSPYGHQTRDGRFGADWLLHRAVQNRESNEAKMFNNYKNLGGFKNFQESEKRMLERADFPFQKGTGRTVQSPVHATDPYTQSFVKFVQLDYGASSLAGLEINDSRVLQRRKYVNDGNFRDLERENFEAELEIVQKSLEEMKIRKREEEERAAELERKGREERECLEKEKEERQLRFEEEAKQAVAKAEQEALEAVHKLEESQRAKEEEKRLMILEEESRRENARRKLLDLEEKIAKREAESKKNQEEHFRPKFVQNYDLSAAKEDEDSSFNDSAELSSKEYRGERHFSRANDGGQASFISLSFEKSQFDVEVSDSLSSSHTASTNDICQEVQEFGISLQLNDVRCASTPLDESQTLSWGRGPTDRDGGKKLTIMQQGSSGGYRTNLCSSASGDYTNCLSTLGKSDSSHGNLSWRSPKTLGDTVSEWKLSRKALTSSSRTSHKSEVYPSKYSWELETDVKPEFIAGASAECHRKTLEEDSEEEGIEETMEDREANKNNEEQVEVVYGQRLKYEEEEECHENFEEEDLRDKRDEVDDSIFGELSSAVTGNSLNQLPILNMSDVTADVIEANEARADDALAADIGPGEDSIMSFPMNEQQGSVLLKDTLHSQPFEIEERSFGITEAEFGQLGVTSKVVVQSKELQETMESNSLAFQVLETAKTRECDIFGSTMPQVEEGLDVSVRMNGPFCAPFQALSNGHFPVAQDCLEVPAPLQFGLLPITHSTSAIEIGSIQMHLPIHEHAHVSPWNGDADPLLEHVPSSEQYLKHSRADKLRSENDSLVPKTPGQLKEQISVIHGDNSFENSSTEDTPQCVAFSEVTVQSAVGSQIIALSNSDTSQGHTLSSMKNLVHDHELGGEEEEKGLQLHLRSSENSPREGRIKGAAFSAKSNRHSGSWRSEFQLRKVVIEDERPAGGSQRLTRKHSGSEYMMTRNTNEDTFEKSDCLKSMHYRKSDKVQGTMVGSVGITRYSSKMDGKTGYYSSNEVPQNSTDKISAGISSQRHDGSPTKHKVMKDVTLQSGVVHVFEQSGIEIPDNGDDFIEVRSKRQVLHDRRKQQSKSKAKEQAPQKRKSVKQILKGDMMDSKHSIPSVSLKKYMEGTKIDAVGSNSVSLAQSRTPAATFSAPVDGATLATQSSERPSIPKVWSSLNETLLDRKVEVTNCRKASPTLCSKGREGGASSRPVANISVQETSSTTTHAWGAVHTSQQVVSLTQIQLEEVLKPARYDPAFQPQLLSGEHRILGLEVIGSRKSDKAKETRATSSMDLAITKLNGGEIQIGAVSSTYVSPISWPSTPSVLGAVGSTVAIQSDTFTDKNDFRKNFKQYPGTANDTPAFGLQVQRNWQDDQRHKSTFKADAGGEAAALAVAVSSMLNDEAVNNLNDSATLGRTVSAFLNSASPMSYKFEGDASSSCTNDLSVESAASHPFSFVSPQPAAEVSSALSLQALSSAFPSLDFGSKDGGHVFTSNAEPNDPLGMHGAASFHVHELCPIIDSWQQDHVSGSDFFYGGPLQSSMTSANPLSNPQTQLNTHLNCDPSDFIYQFGQSDLGSMNPPYIQSFKQPDWTNILSESSDSIAAGMNSGESGGLGRGLAAQRSLSEAVTPMQWLASGPSLVSVTQPSTPFERNPAAAFQIPAVKPSAQPNWSHASPPPLHKMLTTEALFDFPAQSRQSFHGSLIPNAMLQHKGDTRNSMHTGHYAYSFNSSFIDSVHASVQLPDELGIGDSVW